VTRSSALFLCVATNDIACDRSYLITACSGLPGTRPRYRIGFSVAAPTANGSSISMVFADVANVEDARSSLLSPFLRYITVNPRCYVTDGNFLNLPLLHPLAVAPSVHRSAGCRICRAPAARLPPPRSSPRCFVACRPAGLAPSAIWLSGRPS
jgi:hypothetical protein